MHARYCCAAVLRQGKSLLKVELSLQYDSYEIVPLNTLAALDWAASASVNGRRYGACYGGPT